MNEARFMALLSAYGAEISRWPEEEQREAEALLASASHRLKDIWESERAFDRLLAVDSDPVAAPVLLEARILSRVPQPASGRRDLVGAPMRWLAGGALAASLAAGFVAGYVSEPAAEGDSEYSEILRISGGNAGAMFLSAMIDRAE